MGLKDRAEKSPPSKGPKCRACVAEGQMTKRERETFRGWLAHPVLSAKQITEWAIEDGYSYLTKASIERHRRGDCLEARRVTN